MKKLEKNIMISHCKHLYSLNDSVYCVTDKLHKYRKYATVLKPRKLNMSSIEHKNMLMYFYSH